MSWQGANLKKKKRKQNAATISSETVEAALNRLSKAYSAAMDCVGNALRFHQIPIARAGRQVFEKAILKEPLVLENAISWRETVGVAAAESTVMLRSAGHQATLKQLSYLSLVNYADLLLVGIPASKERDTILDRGVIKCLKCIEDESCWILPNEGIETNTDEKDTASDAIDIEEILEPEAESVRYALVSYSDAAALDSSDPTLWLKMACAARRLGYLEGSKTKYRRMERHALERALTSLPTNFPPNPTAVRAMKEFQKEQDDLDSREYSVELAQMPKSEPLLLELTRYSWSNLGRMLLRVCKEGSSQIVSVRLSPMLVLPVSVLATVCSYLEPNQIWRFEATCRAMSASVISARALLAKRRQSLRREPFRSPIADNKPTTAEETAKVEAEGSSAKEAEGQKASDEAKSSQSDHHEHSKRISKRVRSQMITSGKRAERSKRRNSVEFCLLASTLGCTKDDARYRKIQRLYFRWGELRSPDDEQSKNTDVYSLHQSDHKSSLNHDDSSERLRKSSLVSFICSLTDHSPLSSLFRFVAHSSLYISDVFSNDPSGSFMLSSFLLECITLMVQRTNLNGCLISSWSDNRIKVPRNANLRDIDVFAIDLLHAELRLKRCDGEEIVDTDFDGDAAFVSSIIPSLNSTVCHLESESTDKTLLEILKVRCFWLTANFYFWRGKLACNVAESREAETEGLSFIIQAKECLASIQKYGPVATPHLSSPNRRGLYWKDLSVANLISFADEIQASSVVLLAQEKFLEATEKFSDTSNELQEEDCCALFSIGKSLIERYSTKADDPDAKYSELIDDLVGVHGDQILSTSFDKRKLSEEAANSFDVLARQVIPLGSIKSVEPLLSLNSPCILTILIICLNVKEGNEVEVAMLLVRLVLTVCDLSQRASKRHQEELDAKERNQSRLDTSDSDSMSGDDFSSDDDSDEEDAAKVGNTTSRLKMQQYATLAQILLAMINVQVDTGLKESDKDKLVQSPEFLYMIKSVLEFSTDWSINRNQSSATESGEDLGMLSTLQSLINNIRSSRDGICFRGNALRVYVFGLMQLVSSQKRTLATLSKAKLRSRTERVRLSRKHADVIASACCSLGLLMSESLGAVSNGRLATSSLFFGHGSPQETATEISMFASSILWLWKVSAADDKKDVAKKPVPEPPAPRSCLDKFGIDRLRVPVASALIAFCGAIASTDKIISFISSPEPDISASHISLIEFYESDASATEWLADGDENDGNENDRKQEELLRVISQAVHCISRVFGDIDEKEAIGYSWIPEYYQPDIGPSLPLVVSRVLNAFAHHLLTNFRDNEDDSKAIWSDYSFGTQTVGSVLDQTLCKVYKCLHGFTISSTTETKDAPISGGSNVVDKVRHVLPENPRAAAMLYRLIMRVYGHGRKSPPKVALETVLAALPQIQGNRRSLSIRKYLFENDSREEKISDLMSLIKQEVSSEAFSGLDLLNIQNDELDDCLDETTLVHRGVSRLIAQGALPRYQDSGDENDARPSSAHAEEELARKFLAILDCLCCGDINDCESWFKASQCLAMKADIIADRLGFSLGFMRTPDFVFQERQGLATETMSLAQLLSSQELESESRNEAWLGCLGTDLSVFISHSWSSFESLKACAAAIGKLYSPGSSSDVDDEVNKAFQARVWNDLNDMFQKEDYVKWQQGWGGLFVSSLRKVSYRCLSLALLFSFRNRTEKTNKLLISEIIESLGVSFYSELMGSQGYGYPLHKLSQFHKRALAEAALGCFEKASSSQEDSSGNVGMVWDLYFMIGKCYEKIAKSFAKESFSSCTEIPSGNLHKRKYEHYMALAIKAYAMSVSQAKEAENEGEAIVEESGGSAHGSLEVVYRLHASRLKCLISAVDRCEADRALAEEEALRLTECNWFKEQKDEIDVHNIRERVWRVFVDVVDALAKCRLEKQFFHRSVYRHAQALLWAPIICDPVGGRADGSLGTVSATWACKVRGLNYATNAASSALSVLSILFNKKRPQLVAVWVTGDGTSSIFQTLNNSVRKYDSLRGKYIGAYIECLRLCRRRKDLDMFLRWMMSSKRDFPSYFAASAISEGNKPKVGHHNDCLLVKRRNLHSMHFLTTGKRLANSALANVILHDVNDRTNEKDSEKDSKYYMEQLKLSYACFLRLRCDTKFLTKNSSWKYSREIGALDVVEALTTVYLKVEKDKPKSNLGADWSGEAQLSNLLQSAVDKCKELFPTLTPAFSFTRPSSGSKRGTASKQKLVKKSFEVAVPEGLKEGETFFTQVNIGEGSSKKVKLTVPPGASSNLRFNLQVSEPEESSKSKKLRLSSGKE